MSGGTRTVKKPLKFDNGFGEADTVLYIDVVQSFGGDPRRTVRVSDGTYHHATNPDTGLPAVFLPGEAVPDWALSADDRKKLGMPT